jgi:spermidine synthase
VILLRELSAAFYGVDLIYLLALGAWLLWTAAGALLARRSLDPSTTRVITLLTAIGAVVPLDVALIRRLRLLAGGVPGAYLPLPEQIAASALCLLPPSLLLGLLFQWAAKRYLSDSSRDRGSGIKEPTLDLGPRTSDLGHRTPDVKRSLARAYAIESVGGVVGGLATTLTLHWRLPNVALALATGGLAFVAATVAIDRLRAGRPRGAAPTRAANAVRLVAASGALLCLLAGWHERRLDRWMTSWNHPDLVDTLDSPYGRVTVTERAGQVSIYENDVLVFESEGTAPEELVHLGLLQREAPRRVLVLHGAAAGLLSEVAQYGGARIDDVELEAGVVELLARRLPAIEQSLSSPGVHVIFDDPRRALARGGDLYDVIIVATEEPSSAQANRFFTREFFELCAARLQPGGVVALRLTSIENLWTAPLIARTSSIYGALRQVFRDVVVLPGSTNIVLASPTPLVRDPQVLGARLAARAIHARMVTARYVAYLYSNDRFTEIETLLARRRAPPNTDANAASYQATSIFWLSKFVPSFARLDLTGTADAYGWSAPRSWLLLALGAAIAVFWRWRRWPRRSLLVGVAAFAGMTIETLLLLHYQLKHGVMFQDLGILLMSVMAGLAAGAWLGDPRSRSARVRRAVFPQRLFLGGLAVLAILVSIGIRTGYGAGFLAIAIMLFAAGVAVAGVFACASVGDSRQTSPTCPTSPTRPFDQRRLVSPLYAADVLGGCLGSVAASLLLVPLLGLPLTAEWCAALAALALVLG